MALPERLAVEQRWQTEEYRQSHASEAEESDAVVLSAAEVAEVAAVSRLDPTHFQSIFSTSAAFPVSAVWLPLIRVRVQLARD